MKLEKELEYLKKRGFIGETIDSSHIRLNMHMDPIWAEAFWRRRIRHSRRSDPEIDVINKYIKSEEIAEKQLQLLEIGSAYGRVTLKLAALQGIEWVTGMELCPFFEPYVKNFANMSSDRLNLHHKISFIVGDVFDSRELEPSKYDLIVLPMNTLPSFKVSLLPLLFTKVSELLSSNGVFVFSTYPESINTPGEMISNELLVDLDNLKAIPLASEFFTLAENATEWGLESVTYSKYTYLNEKYPDQTRYFRTTRSLMKHDKLKKIIEAQGLTISFSQKIDHSQVMMLTL